MTVRPGRGPQGAVEAEGQTADAEVLVATPKGELAGRGIEDLDALVRRDEQAIRVWLHGERDRHTVAESVDDLARVGVELQQRASARRRPEPSFAVERQVENRIVQVRPGRAGLSALGGEAEDFAAVRSAGNQ